MSSEIIDENFDKMILEEISSDLCQVFGKKVKIGISLCFKGAKSQILNGLSKISQSMLLSSLAIQLCNYPYYLLSLLLSILYNTTI